MKPTPITTLTAHLAETVRVRIQRNIKIARAKREWRERQRRASR